MNFFQNLLALNTAGDYKIGIAKTPDGRLAVSVMLFNQQCEDDALKLIPPLVLEGTPQELDEGFFSSIAQPLQEVSQLFVNVLAHQKQLEQAKAQSKMEKDKTDRFTKEKADKQKRYDEAIKKAAELETQGKFRDAYVKVPDPADYPEKAEELRKLKAELASKFEPNLFNS